MDDYKIGEWMINMSTRSVGRITKIDNKTLYLRDIHGKWWDFPCTPDQRRYWIKYENRGILEILYGS